jgi:homeobox protein cut-like
LVIFLKVKISEKSNLLEEAEKKITELTSKVEEQQKLILKLEDDILKVDSLPFENFLGTS